MARLLSMPAELIYESLSYLPQSSLHAVCGSCKTLRSYAEPLLYSSVEFAFAPIPNPRPPGALGKGYAIHLFFRTILHRPELAAHVKVARFTVEDEPDKPQPLNLVVVPPPPDLLQAWREGYGQAGLSDGSENGEAVKQGRRYVLAESEDAIEQGHPCALAAVLLSRLHHLAILEVDFNFVKYDQWLVRRLLVRMLRPTMPMGSETECGTRLWHPKLKRVSVTNNLDGKIVRTDCEKDKILKLFCLPTLEEADLIINGHWRGIRWGDSYDEGGYSLPNLRRLGLLYCSSASPATLGQMLAVTPRLETLELFLAEDLEHFKAPALTFGWRREVPNEWRDFATALRHVRGSLKSLVISVDFSYLDDWAPDNMDMDYVNGMWQRRGDLGSLQDFSALERLEVPIFMLLGWLPGQADRGLSDVLPRNLKELCLRDDLADCEEEEWTTWSSLRKFHETRDAEDILKAIADYVSPLMAQGEGTRPLALESICLKIENNTFWYNGGFHLPYVQPPYLRRLKDMSEAAGISCTIRVYMTEKLERWCSRTDEFMEITIFDRSSLDDEQFTPKSTPEGTTPRAASESDPEEHPSTYLGYSCRYFNEHRRQFRYRGALARSCLASCLAG